MKNERFINGIKNGGITIAIIYSIFSISLEIINYIITGKGSNFSKGISGVVFIVIYTILTAGLYGSSNDILEGKLVSFMIFLQNGKKYFLRTLGYTFLYVLAFCFVLIIPFTLISFSNPQFSNVSIILIFIFGFVIQAIITPLIILKVIDKETKGFIKKNYVIILIFSLITCFLNFVPIVGKYFYIILNSFYPLLIISMCDSFKSIECNKNAIQDVNNSNL